VIDDETVAEPATFELVLPDEPPPGSVVLDRLGRAWQRLEGDLKGLHWHVAGTLESFFPLGWDGMAQCTWGQLLLQRGPVTLVYRPEKITNREDTK
jgi:hypothetical protein